MTADATPQHGPSSIAALQPDPAEFTDANGPWTVHGIALGEGDETVGVSGQRVRWPREALEDAAALLEGKKLTDGRNHEDLSSGQPPTSAIIGEVTTAAYEPGVGIRYAAEVDDPDIARLIHRDRVDVSPVIAFEATEAEDGEGLVAEEIQAFRDLAVVAEGAAPSNDISPGTPPAPVAAAARAGLSAMFRDALKTVAGVTFEGTRGGQLDESEIPSDDFESHYLFDGDTKSDSAYPVVDADGMLRRGNVESAFAVGARGSVSESELHSKLQALNNEFDSPPLDPEQLEAAQAIGGDDAPTGQSTDGPANADASPSDQTTTTDMTEDDISDAERALLAKVDDPDEAIEVLQEHDSYEEPHTMEQSEYESLQEENERLEGENREVREALALQLTEDEFAAEALAEQYDCEALVEKVTDGGEQSLDEALRQEPESGGAETGGDDPDPEVEALVDDLNAADRDEAAALLEDRYQKYQNAGWDTQAQAVAEDLERLGVEVS